MELANKPPSDFQFQLDEFYLDLGADRRSINLLTKAEIEQRPFPGLRPFKTAEFFLFNGRDGQAEELITRLRHNHFLAVIGSSGTGKSSLVRAGLTPQLLGGYMHEVGSAWDIAICRPGKNPIEALAVALARVKCGSGNTTAIEEQYKVIEPLLNSTIYGILDVYNLLNPPGLPKEQKAGLLILVDQFEELFRFKREDLHRPDIETQFVNLLLQAASSAGSGVHVVITMRSEFLGDCVKFRGLPEAINQGQYLVPQLSREQIKKVIEGPIKLAGKKIASGLVEYLVNEIEDSKSKNDLDQLPILQHTMMRTYQHAVKKLGGEEITYTDYEEVGGMQKALANHAQEKFDALGDGAAKLSQRQEIARLIFQALTDTGKDKKGGRRPTELKYLYAIAASINATKQTVDEVINHFRDNETSFIMPPLNTPLFPDLMMDISHESLMRQWSTLKTWMAQEQENAEKFRYYSRQVIDGRELLTGTDLAVANKWQTEQNPSLEWSEKYADNFDEVTAYISRSNSRQKGKRIRNILIGIGAFLMVGLGLWAFNSNLKTQGLKKGQADILSLTREPFYSSGMLSPKEKDNWILSLVKKKYEQGKELDAQHLIDGLNTASKAYMASSANASFMLVKKASQNNIGTGLDTVLTNILNHRYYYNVSKAMLPANWEYGLIQYEIAGNGKYMAAKFMTVIKVFRIAGDSLTEIKELTVQENATYYHTGYSAMRFTNDERFVVYTENNIYNWDIKNNFSLTRNTVKTDQINYTISAISPDGKLLVMDDNVDRIRENFSRIKLIVIATGASISLNNRSDLQTNRLVSLKFSGDSKTLLVARMAGVDTRYGMYQVSNGRYVDLVKMNNTGEGPAIFSADGKFVIKVVGKPDLKSSRLQLFGLYDTTNLSAAFELPAQVNNILLSADEKSMLIESDNAATLYLNEKPSGEGVQDFFKNEKGVKVLSTIKVISLQTPIYNNAGLALLDENRMLSIPLNSFVSSIELNKHFGPFKNFEAAKNQLENIAPLSLAERLENDFIQGEKLTAIEAVQAGAYYQANAYTGVDSTDTKYLLLAAAQFTSSILLGSGKPDSNWQNYVENLKNIYGSLYGIDSNTENYTKNLQQLLGYQKKINLDAVVKKQNGDLILSTLYGDLAYYQVLSGNYKEGIELSKSGLKLYPENYFIYTNLALGYLLSGQLDSAKIIYNRFTPGQFYKKEADLTETFKWDLEYLEYKKMLPKNNNIQAYVDALKKRLK